MKKEDVNRVLVAHFNELTGKNKDIGKERMEICNRCPLLTDSSIWGPICNSSLFLNKETMDTSEEAKPGYIRGCGCRLNAKTKDLKSHCPTKQW